MAYSPSRTGDQAVDRNFAEVKRALDALERLGGASQLLVRRLVGTGAIPAGSQLVAYAGDGGDTLTLPSSRAQGTGTGQQILVANVGGGTLTVAAAGQDTINGIDTLSVAAGSLAVLASDANGHWTAPVTGGSGGVTDGDKGDITVSGGGLNWQIDAAAVGTPEIAPLAVIETHIADAAVTRDKIEPGAVENDRLAPMDEATIKGRAEGAGTGDPQDLTAAEVFEIIDDEVGTAIAEAVAEVDTASIEDQMAEQDRKYLLLLRHLFLTWGQVPGGLEDDIPRALAAA